MDTTGGDAARARRRRLLLLAAAALVVLGILLGVAWERAQAPREVTVNVAIGGTVVSRTAVPLR